MQHMNHIATVALMLNLGVAGVYADQKPLTMTFSGTAGASTIDLKVPNTTTNEDNLVGNGTLGSFTFRSITAIMPTPSSTCSGPFLLHASRVAGAGVFNFQDGSLLKVLLTQGDDCIDLQKGVATCIMTFQIVKGGGTGRFQNATGKFTMTEAVVRLLPDHSGNPVFFASSGTFTGSVSGVTGEEGQDERH